MRFERGRQWPPLQVGSAGAVGMPGLAGGGAGAAYQGLGQCAGHQQRWRWHAELTRPNADGKQPCSSLAHPAVES